MLSNSPLRKTQSTVGKLDHSLSLGKISAGRGQYHSAGTAKILECSHPSRRNDQENDDRRRGKGGGGVVVGVGEGDEAGGEGEEWHSGRKDMAGVQFLTQLWPDYCWQDKERCCERDSPMFDLCRANRPTIHHRLLTGLCTVTAGWPDGKVVRSVSALSPLGGLTVKWSVSALSPLAGLTVKWSGPSLHCHRWLA